MARARSDHRRGVCYAVRLDVIGGLVRNGPVRSSGPYNFRSRAALKL